MRRTLLIVAAACALAAAHPVLAGTFYPSNTPSLAPQATEPMILGEVTDITSQAVMVRTPDGQVLPMHYDSRTVMSHQLETGTAVKVAYELQSDNVYRAQRITPIEHGSGDWDELVAMKANGGEEGDQYATNDYDNDSDDNGQATANNGDYDNDHDRDNGSVNDQYSGHANDESDMSGRPYDNDNNNNSGDNDHDRDDQRQLPTTASPLTLVLMTGWLLLTAAGCMWLVRRRGV